MSGRESNYTNEPLRCNSNCPYHTSEGCIYPVTIRETNEPVSKPVDGFCQFPQAHQDGEVTLRLGGFEDRKWDYRGGAFIREDLPVSRG